MNTELPPVIAAFFQEAQEKGAPDRRFLTRETAEREVAGL